MGFENKSRGNCIVAITWFFIVILKKTLLNQYEKSCLLKPHYPATKTQKTTHIQLLCNYPLGITTIVQLSPYKYNVLINKLPCQKIN
jgi:hypothetical protein